MNLKAIEIKAFVPARDFELSKNFYIDLGFEMFAEGPELCYFRHDTATFLLQKFYVAEHANNFMMHLLVEDVDAWWERVQVVIEKYGARAEPPEDRPWGIRDFILVDPTSVLWRVGQVIR